MTLVLTTFLVLGLRCSEASTRVHQHIVRGVKTLQACVEPGLKTHVVQASDHSAAVADVAPRCSDWTVTEQLKTRAHLPRNPEGTVKVTSFHVSHQVMVLVQNSCKLCPASVLHPRPDPQLLQTSIPQTLGSTTTSCIVEISLGLTN
jgi:hypothetical protein